MKRRIDDSIWIGETLPQPQGISTSDDTASYIAITDPTRPPITLSLLFLQVGSCVRTARSLKSCFFCSLRIEGTFSLLNLIPSLGSSFQPG
jgi:hypothetical protein